MRPNLAISELEIQAAINQFQSSGGKIVHVPDQATPRRREVGGRWITVDEVLGGANTSLDDLEIELDIMD